MIVDMIVENKILFSGNWKEIVEEIEKRFVNGYELIKIERTKEIYANGGIAIILYEVEMHKIVKEEENAQ